MFGFCRACVRKGLFFRRPSAKSGRDVGLSAIGRRAKVRRVLGLRQPASGSQMRRKTLVSRLLRTRSFSASHLRSGETCLLFRPNLSQQLRQFLRRPRIWRQPQCTLHKRPWLSTSRQHQRCQGSGRRTVPRVSERYVLGRNS